MADLEQERPQTDIRIELPDHYTATAGIFRALLPNKEKVSSL
jgi:hypothetical protein